ncbi:hypothetical protein V6N12_024828 [Hibiscus sabdariffa]|uniref:Uncharacterized protein n=1 Tax=Hibiscus sabdariffa TaxID=183260 RepID=A0ABR2BA79_9ROSI
MFPKKTIPAVVVVNLAEEMGKLGPNSNPSFAAILQLALQSDVDITYGSSVCMVSEGNGEVLLEVDDGKMTSLDLSSQQRGASLYLNCEQMEFHGVEVGADLLSVHSFVDSSTKRSMTQCPQRE